MVPTNDGSLGFQNILWQDLALSEVADAWLWFFEQEKGRTKERAAKEVAGTKRRIRKRGEKREKERGRLRRWRPQRKKS
jgi:hypothetical protein